MPGFRHFYNITYQNLFYKAGTLSIRHEFELNKTVTLNLSSCKGYNNFLLYKNIFPVFYSQTIQSGSWSKSEINAFVLDFSYNQSTGILTLVGKGMGFTAFSGSFDIYILN